MTYWEADQIEQAIINYTKAIELDPDYDIAYNNLGVVFLDGLGKADGALTNFEQAIEINPNYVLAYFNKGRAHEALGEKIEAANSYQTAINLNQNLNEVSPELIEERLFKLFDI
jgi:tetratricopeptide (TPR) repeat protein